MLAEHLGQWGSLTRAFNNPAFVPLKSLSISIFCNNRCKKIVMFINPYTHYKQIHLEMTILIRISQESLLTPIALISIILLPFRKESIIQKQSVYVTFENSLGVLHPNREWIKTIIFSLNFLMHDFKVFFNTKKRLKKFLDFV